MKSYLKVELLHSAIARDGRQRKILLGLGLKRRHQQRILQNSPAIRGMIQKVLHLIRFEETQSDKLDQREKEVTYSLGAIKGVEAKPAVDKSKSSAVAKVKTAQTSAKSKATRPSAKASSKSASTKKQAKKA